MKKKLLTILLCCLTVNCYADDPGASLTQLLQKIQTYQAHFAQRIKDANGQHVSKTQGEVVIQRPGKFYWKSAQPDPVLIVSDGTYLWTYDIDLEQVTKQELKEVLRNSPAGLMAGKTDKITENYNVSMAKPAQCSKNSEQCYSLKPKQQDATFASIVMGFNKGELVEIRMRDPLGQDVQTLFSQVQMNPKVNKSKFAFNPPKGIDIIQSGN